MKNNWPIVGHEDIIDFFQEAVKNGKLSHAYLFFGPEGLGKFRFAKILAKNLICPNTKDIFCGECGACKKFENLNHPDVFILDAKEQGGISNIKDLIKRVQLVPLEAKIKIAIIDNADNLTLEAANALLKTLEEPPSKTMIILIAEDSGLLPETIRSRCQPINFKNISDDILKKFAKSCGVNNGEIDYVVSRALGRPGLIEKNKFEQDKDLGLCLDLIGADVFDRFSLANKIEVEIALPKLLIIYRDLLMCKIGTEERVINKKDISKLRQLSGGYSVTSLLKIIRKIIESEELLKKNVSKKLLFENLLLAF